VFTHLPENMQFHWLRELHRVTRRGACCFSRRVGQTTFRSRAFSAEISAEGVRLYLRRQTPGLPDFYRNAFHDEAYIRRRWGPLFEVIAHRRRGIAGEQDWTLCRKRVD
jgi:hypothetical protein